MKEYPPYSVGRAYPVGESESLGNVLAELRAMRKSMERLEVFFEEAVKLAKEFGTKGAKSGRRCGGKEDLG